MTQPMQTPVTLIVAPNGARRMPADHPRLPITPDSTAFESMEALKAGASVVHLHARDDSGAHTLNPEINRQFMQAVRDVVGDEMVIQLTTEAVGIYQPDEQMQLIYEVRPEAASFAIKELIPSDSDADKQRGQAFFQWVKEQGIIAQFILYSAEDVARYHRLKRDGILPGTLHHLLFVLGRYTEGQRSEPTDLLPMLEAHTDNTPWAVCAFGEKEHLCAASAITLGGDVRLGFENNLHANDGSLADSNATLIQQAADVARAINRPIMTASQFRQQFLEDA